MKNADGGHNRGSPKLSLPIDPYFCFRTSGEVVVPLPLGCEGTGGFIAKHEGEGDI
jgi:hypothetical protein